MGRVSSFPHRLKKRLYALSGHISPDYHPHSQSDAGTGGEAGEEKAALPTPSASFPSLLSRNKGTATRELVLPYLANETALRKAFAGEAGGISDDANLVPVYNGHEKLFITLGVDRKTGDGEKYLMPLGDRERENDGSLAYCSEPRRVHAEL